jgi:predicted alpha/beta superfamily hydrolase
VRLVGNTERFPVLYVTDSDHFFGGLADLANLLQVMGDTPRFVLVGIGYEPAEASRLLRWRDFVSHSIRRRFHSVLEQLIASSLVQGVSDLKEITETTDASDFLNFIRDELMPFVNDRYPTVHGDSSYFGYSAGGTFGLYTLFRRPDTFRRYILGSPATSFSGDNFGTELVREFVASEAVANAKVYISVGELEEFERGQSQCDLVSGYYLLRKVLQQVNIPGLDIAGQVFPGETHSTAWTLAFSHGLRKLLGPVDRVPYVPVWK